MSSEKTDSVYENIAEEYAEKFSEPSEHIDEFLKRVPEDGRILDVGCGVGIDSGYATSQGFEVVGVDLSEGMLKEARSKFSKPEFIEADIRDLDFEQNSFDGVIASFSLIHLPKEDVEPVISTFNKILKSKGLLFIGLQAGEPEEVTVEQPLNPEDEIFLNLMSENEIKDILKEQGLSVVEKFEREPEPGEFQYNKLFLIARND